MRLTRTACATLLVVASVSVLLAAPVPKIDRDQLKRPAGEWEITHIALHTEPEAWRPNQPESPRRDIHDPAAN